MSTSVLIVDDETNFLVLLEWILSREGFQVQTTSDAYQAMKLVERKRFHLAILDIQMYPVDGMSLLSELRRRSPSTTVLMTTAYPAQNIRNECMKHGAAALLLKPVDLQELKSVARALVAS